ncbi:MULTISPECIES: ABC transporter ATP-binding protein [Paenibacillus]|uniref:ABC transporter ATP-binding protein n=1 Tax=Paenibacillus albilobatus TaxID=2716884 RepID=A0A919XN29_9BACL|nr:MULTISPECIES: ABC transporter ATP-binding protein [Paenibacillus]GIO33425.1 ABC transporter ATP-binding protein [Paenibacillus albilobatus]
MNAIELRQIHVQVQQKHILKGIDLTIEEGDFVTLLGPSGCGKTTLLRTIAGLQKLNGGTVVISGNKVADGSLAFHLDPAKRGVSLVFQSYALWPHMTVFDNVAFGLQVRKQPKAEIRKSVRAALDKMRIPELADRYPGELSGGQQQRVAIARAIVTNPSILLLDEPLSNLDAKLRTEMRAELKRLHRELGTTIVYVTHDQHEAITLSTKVAVFFGGELVQADTPRELYRHPRTLQVAEFMGSSDHPLNRVEGMCRVNGNESILGTPLGSFRLAGPDGGADRAVVLTLRPEDIALHETRVPGSIPVKVEDVLPAGGETLVRASFGQEKLSARVMGDPDYVLGRVLYATFREDRINLYDRETGSRLDTKLTTITPVLEEMHR